MNLSTAASVCLYESAFAQHEGGAARGGGDVAQPEAAE